VHNWELRIGKRSNEVIGLKKYYFYQKWCFLDSEKPSFFKKLAWIEVSENIYLKNDIFFKL